MTDGSIRDDGPAARFNALVSLAVYRSPDQPADGPWLARVGLLVQAFPDRETAMEWVRGLVGEATR